MFVAIEKYRTGAQILLGLIAVSFVGFGVSQFQIVGSSRPYIVKIGDEAITRQQVDNMLRQSPNQSRESVLRALMNRAYLLEGAKQLGLTVSDAQVKQRIVDMPTFHDEQGKFSPELFKQILQASHISEQDFMNIERQNTLVESLNHLLNSNVISDAQLAQFMRVTMAERSMRSAGIDPQAFESKVVMSDEALKKFYAANQAAYTLPQAVQFAFVRFSPKTLAEKETVSDEELKKAISEAASQAGGQKRRIAHILIEFGNDKAKAKTQAEELAKQLHEQPQKFAELAKQYSQDADSKAKGGVIGEFSEQGDLVDAAFKKVAFALKSGDVSGVVETPFGFHIIQATDLQGADAVNEDTVRQAVKERKAQPAYTQLREQFSDKAFDSGSLQKTAEQLGLTVQNHTEWLTQENAPAAKMPKEVVDALFSDDVFTKKHLSEAISVNGETWFVQATQTRPKTVQSFEQVKDQVKTDYLRSESARLAKEAAQKWLADLQAGKTVDLTWTPVQKVSPEKLYGNVSPESYRQLMAAAPKNGQPAYVLVDNLGVPQIVEIQAIDANAGSNAEENMLVKQLIMPVTQQKIVSEALMDSLSKTIHTEQGTEKLTDAE